MKNYNKLGLLSPRDTMGLEDIFYLRIYNTENPDDTFYKNTDYTEKFELTKAKEKSRFVDGSNGDSWRVIMIEPTSWKRALVQNLTQDYIVLITW